MLSLTFMSKRPLQILDASLSESFSSLDLVHTVVFPEGITLMTMVEYNITVDSPYDNNIHDEKDLTIKSIELHPSTDASVWVDESLNIHCMYVQAYL